MSQYRNKKRVAIIYGDGETLTIISDRPSGEGGSGGVEVAGGPAAVAPRVRRRLDLAADVHHERAPGVEPAAGRRVQRARDVARQDDPLP